MIYRVGAEVGCEPVCPLVLSDRRRARLYRHRVPVIAPMNWMSSKPFRRSGSVRYATEAGGHVPTISARPSDNWDARTGYAWAACGDSGVMLRQRRSKGDARSPRWIKSLGGASQKT